MELGQVSLEGWRVMDLQLLVTQRVGQQQDGSQGLLHVIAFIPELCDLDQANPFICETDMLTSWLITRTTKTTCDIPLSAIK